MPRPRKYDTLYGRNDAYRQSEKGKTTIKKYESSEARRAQKRDWARKNRGTIVDKRQWFIDSYGDIETALSILDPDQRNTIQLYYGLGGDKPLVQKDIASKLNKSRSQISRIKLAAIAKLNSLNINKNN